MGLAQRLVKGWYQGCRWLWLLWPLSLLFGAIVWLRQLAFKRGWLASERLPCPLWVVGNITVGGAGKTPLTIALVQALKARGISVGVISRGYGARNLVQPRLVDGQSAVEEVGDEPLLIARRCGVPLAVHANRLAAGRLLLAQHPDIQLLLADDGLQHYRLQRDCELAVIDGERRLGNGWLLPAGPLREPPSRLLAAQALICNGGQPQAGEWPMQLVPGDWCALNGERQPQLPAAKRRWALAGIAHPQRFFNTLAALGVETERQLALDDHFALDDDWISQQVPADVQLLLTEKDAVKLSANLARDCWFLAIDAELPEQLITELIRRQWPQSAEASPLSAAVSADLSVSAPGVDHGP